MCFKRAVLLLCVISILSIASSAWARLIPEDFVVAAANSNLVLYVRPHDGQLIINDLATDLIWRSNPDVSDIIGFGMLSDVWQGNLQSPIYLDYFDRRRNVRGANAYYGDPDIEFSYKENGFVISYYFPQLEIGFTVEYTLEADNLVAVVPWDSVSIGNEDWQLLSLRILPFLSAQPSNVDPSGFMIVPDGCGGLVRFKDSVSLSQTGFSQWIYGLDPAAAPSSYDPYREPVAMPIFGLKAMKQAFLGVVELGQEAAKIIATPAGVITDFNWAAAEFWYSQSIIMRTSRQGSGIRIFDENPIPGDRSIRFYFLTEEDANYVSMAETYRNYLLDHQGATRLDIDGWPAPLMIELLGADYETNIFGPVMQPMTTFEQAKSIVDILLDHNIERFMINYHGWMRMGVNGNLPRRLPAERTLGGDDGLRDLAEYLWDLNIPLLLKDDYTLARGSNNGFQPSIQASRTTFNDLIKIDISTPVMSGFNLPVYLISPRLSLDYAQRDLPQIAEFGIAGMTHLSIGESLNSDHNPNAEKQTYRNETRLIYEELINLTKENVSLVGVTTGNAYVLGLVDFITDIPMWATNDTFIDEQIPFYQLATHGLATYYTPPINLSTNPGRDLLRAVEYGALPSFVLSFEPSWKLRYTLSSDMYSTYYLDWLPEVMRQYQLVNKSMFKVHDQFMINHQKLDANVYITEYENGIQFIVNYSSQAYIFNGIEIEGNSFIVIDQEGVEIK